MRQGSFFRDRDQEMREAFERCHRAHPEVWREFVRFSLQMACAGRRFGGQRIMERIRWDVDLGEGRDEHGLKINDHHIAFYTRAFKLFYPEYAHLVETRQRTSVGAPPRGDDGFHVDNVRGIGLGERALAEWLRGLMRRL